MKNELLGKDEGSESVCTCKEFPEDEHTCPFKEEINDDHETMCSCCSECTYQCAMDV